MIISLGIQPLLMSVHDSNVQARIQSGIDQSVLEETKSIYTKRFRLSFRLSLRCITLIHQGYRLIIMAQFKYRLWNQPRETVKSRKNNYYEL